MKYLMILFLFSFLAQLENENTKIELLTKEEFYLKMKNEFSINNSFDSTILCKISIERKENETWYEIVRDINSKGLKVDIWNKILPNEDISININFFDLFNDEPKILLNKNLLKSVDKFKYRFKVKYKISNDNHPQYIYSKEFKIIDDK